MAKKTPNSKSQIPADELEAWLGEDRWRGLQHQVLGRGVGDFATALESVWNHAAQLHEDPAARIAQAGCGLLRLFGSEPTTEDCLRWEEAVTPDLRSQISNLKSQKK